MAVISTRNGKTQRSRYGYDGFSRQMWKQDASRVTVFIWDSDRLLNEISDQRSHLWIYEDEHGFASLAQITHRTGEDKKEARIYWYHNDASGLPRELTDAEGNIVWWADYHGWGRTAQVRACNEDEIHQPLRYQGQYHDEETGLHYNRFRYYDPECGRFISQGPTGLASDHLTAPQSLLYLPSQASTYPIAGYPKQNLVELRFSQT
ncbi:RHS domain-containing protein [Enterobacteriaceae bacterium ESL0689]|nr:RHS domain-containing protein [Enterobacteriaceae bacterium ESL0689]